MIFIEVFLKNFLTQRREAAKPQRFLGKIIKVKINRKKIPLKLCVFAPLRLCVKNKSSLQKRMQNEMQCEKQRHTREHRH